MRFFWVTLGAKGYMIYFWLIPVLLLLALLLVLLFRDGTSKRTTAGQSRLDAALEDVRREGLRN